MIRLGSLWHILHRPVAVEVLTTRYEANKIVYCIVSVRHANLVEVVQLTETRGSGYVQTQRLSTFEPS